MASPPFNITETLPEDDDIIANYPAVERTFRDIVESWIKVNHNVNGRHDEVQLDYKADPAAPGASIAEIWASSTGNAGGILKHRDGAAGTVEYVGVPPGVVLDFAGSTAPEGYLLCFGQAVSRTTYARLFDVISTTYGNGDGSTTFNLPDYRGRVGAGKDNMGGVSADRIVDNLTNSLDGDILGDTGGSDRHVLTEAQLAFHTHTVTDPGHVHTLDFRQGSQGTAGATQNLTQSGSNAGDVNSATTGITLGNTGSNAPHNNMQPTIIVNKIIRI